MRLPRDLPLLTAALAGSVLVAAPIGGIGHQLLLGRPSSTAGVGLVFLTFGAAVAGGMGYAAGLLVRGAWRRLWTFEHESWAVAIGFGLVYLAVVIPAFVSGVQRSIRYEAMARPAILVDRGMLEYVDGPTTDRSITPARKVHEGFGPSEEFDWGENHSEVVTLDGRLRIRDPVTDVGADVSTEGLDYVVEVYVAPYRAVDGSTLLLVVIEGRATASRSMFAILDPAYDVVYAERLERSWPFGSNPLEVRIDPVTGDAVGVLGPRGPRPRSFRMGAP